MLFNSEEYLLLLAPAVLLYWLLPGQKARLIVMLIASVLFYASWDWRFLPLLYGAVAGTYALVRTGAARRAIAERPAGAWLVLTVTLNLLLLGVFKYANFILQILTGVSAAAAGREAGFEPLGIILPLGISFFTFQLIAYAVDVERKVIPPERSLLTFAVFISFFPQLIAGPICRGKELLPQINQKQPFSMDALLQGALMLAAGYFIKAGLADNIAPYVETVYNDAQAASAQGALFATIGFALQILFDFWGYSTMALGSAWLFGLMLPVNFNLPYIATSFQSFWRRWHMTLSFWLRDYLYISLGGNRKGAARTYLNLFLVMLLGGLWHGAAFVFIVWGAIHGAALAVERLVSRATRDWREARPAPSLAERGFGFFVKFGQWLLTMSLVLIAWVFFRAESLGDAFAVLAKMGAALAAPVASMKLSASGGLSEAVWFMIVGVVLMYPLHLLNLMGNNQNFYDNNEVWRSDRVDAGGVERSVPVRPASRISIGRVSLPCPGMAKLIIAFWLFAAGYILSSGATVPFIYFQF